MLTRATIQNFKSLRDIQIDFEPLTVLIGPNGSGKSNICQALQTASFVMKQYQGYRSGEAITVESFQNILKREAGTSDYRSKFWQGKIGGSKQPNHVMKFSLYAQEQADYISRSNGSNDAPGEIKESFQIPTEFLEVPFNSVVLEALRDVEIYDFNPSLIADEDTSSRVLSSSGQGIGYALADLLLENRDKFDELEERFTALIPNISGIKLKRSTDRIELKLVDRYSDYPIPPQDISDGTLRILAFLAAIYRHPSPSIICFEEPENGIHPWLLHKLIELLNLVTKSGIMGKSTQVILTTHSTVLLNYVDPKQVRAVELNSEGATEVHRLPVESKRFAKTLEIFEGELGELWFTDFFGGNPG